MSDIVERLRDAAATEVNGTVYDYGDYWNLCDAAADEITRLRAAEARAERYRKALEELVGILEIAAVMPEAIHKQMFVSWDDPALERARDALRGEG